MYKTVVDVANERELENVRHVAAIITEKMLEKNSYYSNLSCRTILRWAEFEKEKKKPGKKVDEVFENEVWGNLMFCVFEKNLTEVIVSVMQFFFYIINAYITLIV